MKLLIFGASGQLGCECQAYLNRLNNEEIASASYTSAELDITRFRDVELEVKNQRPDVIINCAAYTKVDEAEEERQKAYRVNAEAVEFLAQLCKKTTCTLVHFSTDYVFPGKKEDRENMPKGYPEDYQAEPVNWYGQTKWEGEEAIRNSGCRYLIMRTSWLCGAHGNNFVTTMLRLAKDHDRLKVVDDQFGSPTFADNLVKNVFKLIEGDQQGTYHFSSDGIISWAYFAEMIFTLLAKDIEVHGISTSQYPTKAVRPLFSKLDTKKVNSIAGIKTEPWQTGLQQLLQQLNQS